MGICSLYESIFTVNVGPELAVSVHNRATFDQQPPPIITLHEDNMAMIDKFGSVNANYNSSTLNWSVGCVLLHVFRFAQIIGGFLLLLSSPFLEGYGVCSTSTETFLRQGTPHHVCKTKYNTEGHS